MKHITIYLLILLTSCGVQHNINRAKKHTAKAIEKGAVFSVSTDTLYVNDTIVTQRIFTVNDTVYIESIKTIEKVVYQKGEIRYITKKDKRKEVKAVKRKDKLNYKNFKLNNKLDRVKARKQMSFKWVLWLIIGLFGGIILNRKVM